MLAAIRALNRLECVGETLRAALNALASSAPEWLREHVAPEWFDRYSTRIEESRLPKGQEARKIYADSRSLSKKNLLPSEHFLDAGYVDADLVVKSQRDLGVEVIEPMRPYSSWQAKAGQGYDNTHFAVD